MPARCPSTRGRWRCAAQRPLPSMMMATCAGSCSKLTWRASASSGDPGGIHARSCSSDMLDSISRNRDCASLVSARAARRARISSPTPHEKQPCGRRRRPAARDRDASTSRIHVDRPCGRVPISTSVPTMRADHVAEKAVAATPRRRSASAARPAGSAVAPTRRRDENIVALGRPRVAAGGLKRGEIVPAFEQRARRRSSPSTSSAGAGTCHDVRRARTGSATSAFQMR